MIDEDRIIIQKILKIKEGGVLGVEKVIQLALSER
jgi:hypothetical protein